MKGSIGSIVFISYSNHWSDSIFFAHFNNCLFFIFSLSPSRYVYWSMWTTFVIKCVTSHASWNMKYCRFFSTSSSSFSAVSFSYFVCDSIYFDSVFISIDTLFVFAFNWFECIDDDTVTPSSKLQTRCCNRNNTVKIVRTDLAWIVENTFNEIKWNWNCVFFVSSFTGTCFFCCWLFSFWGQRKVRPKFILLQPISAIKR